MNEGIESERGGTHSAEWVARAGPRGARSDGDERALGLDPQRPFMKTVVTGACGFIGYNLTQFLSNENYNLILVDRTMRQNRLNTLRYEKYVDAGDVVQVLESRDDIEIVIHLGASVHTGDTDREAIMKNNFEYSKQLFDTCARKNTRFLYASSAATYGDGSKGFDDMRCDLEPLNYYAESKHRFDEYVRDAAQKPPQWAGLKFFNVYGPHESHKGRMASTVLCAYTEAKKNGVITLFRSHNPTYKDGEQARDFIYVKDIVDVVNFFMQKPGLSGIFNVGTGAARTFIDLARAIFMALEKEPHIEFVDTPDQFRKQYQYFTEANITRLRVACYTKPFTRLEDGVLDYVQNYLERNI